MSESTHYKTTAEEAQRRHEEEFHAYACGHQDSLSSVLRLRDSLRVDDNDDVGYISDDEPDEDEQLRRITPKSSLHFCLTVGTIVLTLAVPLLRTGTGCIEESPSR
jgi:hypothetical protein